MCDRSLNLACLHTSLSWPRCINGLLKTLLKYFTASKAANKLLSQPTGNSQANALKSQLFAVLTEEVSESMYLCRVGNGKHQDKQKRK